MKNYSPTTPGRRGMSTVDYAALTVKKPYKPLTKRLRSNAGRNSAGRITMRHQGGGNKRLYRMVDFYQDKFDMPAKVLTIEYDPYRTAFISLIEYKDGERRYILAPQGIEVGTEILTSEKTPIKVGNRLKLKNIPVGAQVYSVESKPSGGARFARSAGSYAEVLANDGLYTDLRFLSGEVRKVLSDCFASIGQVSNVEHNLINIGKAGRSRWLGVRPTTRAKAMNPVDHPYGGGEGSTQRGTRKPKDIWGNITGGKKTRNRRKWSNKFILKGRPVKSKKETL